MKKSNKILIVIIIFFLYIFVSVTLGSRSKPIYIAREPQNASLNSNNTSQNTSPNKLVTADNGLPSPLDRPKERVTKKPFGIFITPQNSPIQPERFRGYHTGADFEIFPDELNKDVTVRAICDGKIETKKWASGYGGVLAESCVWNNQPITVVYGHLNLSSINKNMGDALKAGDPIGVLGKNKSTETDGERKHLHLGIHKGTDIDIKGYVSDKSQLNEWIDPASVISNSPNF